MSALYDCRDAFTETLEKLAHEDARIVVVVNDAIGSSKLTHFNKTFPDRLINVGIAEQNLVGVAAGLANGGKLPFVCGAACFLTGRSLEQVKVDLAYSDANVKLCGMSSGLAYGALGSTHHSIEDLAWTRAIANLTVIVSADPLETSQAVRAVHDTFGPVFLRISRMPVPVVHPQDYQFQIGKATRLREGRDITFIANGTLVHTALEAADLLAAQGLQARVLNMATVRPLDGDAIRSAAEETGAIVTLEEHTIYGGLGGAVAEAVVSTCPVPMRLLGIPGEFPPTGSAEFIFEYYGLTPQGVCAAAVELLKKKAPRVLSNR